MVGGAGGSKTRPAVEQWWAVLAAAKQGQLWSNGGRCWRQQNKASCGAMVGGAGGSKTRPAVEQWWTVLAAARQGQLWRERQARVSTQQQQQSQAPAWYRSDQASHLSPSGWSNASAWESTWTSGNSHQSRARVGSFRRQEVVHATALMATRKTILDLATWLQCFGIFIAVVAAAQPKRVPELMAYQAIQAKHITGRHGWWMIRLSARKWREQSWAKVDSSLYSVCFFGQT